MVPNTYPMVAPLRWTILLQMIQANGFVFLTRPTAISMLLGSNSDGTTQPRRRFVMPIIINHHWHLSSSSSSSLQRMSVVPFWRDDEDEDVVTEQQEKRRHKPLQEKVVIHQEWRRRQKAIHEKVDGVIDACHQRHRDMQRQLRDSIQALRAEVCRNMTTTTTACDIETFRTMNQMFTDTRQQIKQDLGKVQRRQETNINKWKEEITEALALIDEGLSLMYQHFRESWDLESWDDTVAELCMRFDHLGECFAIIDPLASLDDPVEIMENNIHLRDIRKAMTEVQFSMDDRLEELGDDVRFLVQLMGKRNSSRHSIRDDWLEE